MTMKVISCLLMDFIQEQFNKTNWFLLLIRLMMVCIITDSSIEREPQSVHETA